MSSGCSSKPAVTYLYETIGGADLELELMVSDESHFREMLKDIGNRFAGIIRNYEVLKYYREYKMEWMPKITYQG